MRHLAKKQSMRLNRVPDWSTQEENWHGNLRTQACEQTRSYQCYLVPVKLEHIREDTSNLYKWVAKHANANCWQKRALYMATLAAKSACKHEPDR